MHRLLAPLPAIMLLATATAAAQTTFSLGVRGGVNRALTTTDPAGNAHNYAYDFRTSKAALYTWQAGIAGEITFGKLALQPALVFIQKGEQFYFKTSFDDPSIPFYSERSGTNRYNWLELPINFVYTLHRDHGLQVLAGPYLSLGVGGRQKGFTTGYFGPSANVSPNSYDKAIKYGPNATTRLDAGLNFGLGYRLGPVQVQAIYSLGLRNLNIATDDGYLINGSPYDHNYQADASYNRVVQLTGTYFFKL